MTFSTVMPIWQSIRERFLKSIKALPEQDLSLMIGTASVGTVIRHNAEVEYMFADWYFGKKIPEEITISMSKGIAEHGTASMTVGELLDFLTASNDHLIEAMRELPEDAWHQQRESPVGSSTPLEAVGRLMYHTGIHAGQISLIRKLQAAE